MDSTRLSRMGRAVRAASRHGVRIALTTALAGTAAVAAAGGIDLPPRTASLILTGGKVYTPDGWAEALAVDKGVIVAVGTVDEVNRFRGPATRVVPLNGKAVLPGLHESHSHPLKGARAEAGCQLKRGSTAQEIVATVAQCARTNPPGKWIVGETWDLNSLKGVAPNRQLLDAVTPRNPVYLSDVSHHSGWLNSLALAQAKITRETPNPSDGVIERDPAGEPTGLLREKIAWTVRDAIPAPTLEEDTTELAKTLENYVSYGITSLTDAWQQEPELQAFHALDADGRLKPRVIGCINVILAPDGVKYHNLFDGPRFSPDCVKLFLDGTPTDSHTAAVLVPYKNGDPAMRMGQLQFTNAKLIELLTMLDRQGLTVKMHAGGDRAVKQGLDAIEAVRRANGDSGLRHNIAHNGWIATDEARRARAIGATIEFSPYAWFPSLEIGDIVKGVGEERMKTWYPIREVIDAGLYPVAGSDWPVVPSINPWVGIETMVSRKAPGATGPALGPDHAITLKEALAIYTVNAARQEGMADKLGAIAVGLLADLVVTNQNPFEVPIGRIHETKAVRTFVAGKEIYTAR